MSDLNSEQKTKMAVDIFDRFAAQYETRFMDVSAYGNSFDIFCGLISSPQAEIIELACGPGNVTKYILDKHPHFNITGTDLSPAMLELARKNNPSAHFQLMDCRDITGLNKKFDAVLCAFALPYLSKEESVQLIRDAASVLTKKGAFYISTMEDDYSKSGIETSSSGNTVYMHYHEAGYLQDALRENNFEIVHLHRQEFVKPDGSKMTDLLLVAQKMDE